MCGITLFVNRNRLPLDPSIVQRATATLSHRGPDGIAIEVINHIGVGHARLAIVDISGGGQPIWNEDRTVAVACNGEIYNYIELRRRLEARGHIFKTNSDSEVIIHLYEEDPHRHVEFLIGMFAYFIVDTKRDVVHLVRDRMGIKPLFTYVDRHYLFAASEVKALLQHPAIHPALDGQVISDFLTFGYTMGQRTVFEGIDLLQPGHRLCYEGRSDSISVSQYWKPSFPDRNEYRSGDTNREARRFLEIFQKVVLDHTTGDVPTGVFMSGGIDSTAIAAILSRRHNERTKTFSLSFEDSQFDESAYFKGIVANCKLDSHVERITVPGVEELEWAIQFLEQPQIVTLDTANLRLSASAHRHFYKVVMAGDGADELLGGYDHFSAIELLRDVERQEVLSPLREEILTTGLATVGFPPDFRSAFLSEMRHPGKIRARFGTIPPWYMIWKLNNAIKQPLLRDPWPDTLEPHSTIDTLCEPFRGNLARIDDLNKTIYLELQTRLPNWILWRSDRISMANSIEVRVPYLDPRVIDFFAGLHPALKSTFLNEKAILRQSFKRILPERILRRRKFAFNTPMQWLFDKPTPRVDDLLSEAALRQSGLFNHKSVAALLAEVRMPTQRQFFTHSLKTQTLIGVLTTQMLYQQFVKGEVPVLARKGS